MKMHDDQLDIDDDLVRRLIVDQFPKWSTEPLVRVEGSGTVNAIFRIGDGLVARFPLRRSDADNAARLHTEAAAMEELAKVSPFPVPVHVALGRPARGYAPHWSVQTWLDGVIATPDSASASEAFARDLAEFIAALRAADTRGRRFAGAGRGGDLRTHDDWVAECIRESAPDFDAAAPPPVTCGKIESCTWRSHPRRPRRRPNPRVRPTAPSSSPPPH